jgi:hypothetical protein
MLKLKLTYNVCKIICVLIGCQLYNYVQCITQYIHLVPTTNLRNFSLTTQAVATKSTNILHLNTTKKQSVSGCKI